MVVKEKTKLSTQNLIVTSLIAGLMLVVVNSAIWVNQQVFNTENFTNTAVTSLTSESSRKALGSRITEEMFKDYPIVGNIAGDRVSNLISGLLASDLANKLITTSVSKLQVYVTSNDQQDVAIDLSGIKSILTRLVDVIGSEQPEINPENIPDKIVLIQEKNVPDLYNYGVVLSWLAVVGALATIALLAYAYFRDRKMYPVIMMVQGGALVVFGLISLLIGPLFRPMALEPFHNVDGRLIAANLYDAFISTFNSQTMILVYVGLAVCLIGLGIRMYPALRKLKK